MASKIRAEYFLCFGLMLFTAVLRSGAIEEHLKQARSSYQGGEYTSALEEYMYVLNIDPNNVEARESIDIIWKKMLQKDRESPASAETPDADMGKTVQDAQDQFNRKKYFYFLENFKKVQEGKEKLSPGYLMEQMRLLDKLEQKAEKKMHKNSASSKPRKNLYAAAWFAYRMSSWDRMYESLQKLGELVPFDEEVAHFVRVSADRGKKGKGMELFEQGKGLFKNQKYEEALAVWREAQQMLEILCPLVKDFLQS